LNKLTRWPVALGAGVVLSLGLVAPVAAADDDASSGSQAAAQLAGRLPADWQAQSDAAADRLGLDKSPARAALERAINPDDYECGPTLLDAYVDELISQMTLDDIMLLINTPALDIPTYDALLFGSDTDARYALPADYRQLLGSSFRNAQKFWDIESGDIQLHAMHGDVLLDTARSARLMEVLFGFTPAEAASTADLIAATVTASPALDGGNNPLFTLNAFAFTAEGDPDPLAQGVPDKLVFGDGILDFLEFADIANVGSRAVMGHEFAHHVQFEQGLLESDLPAPEATRRGELMADAFGTYWATHARGLSLNTKRVLQAEQVFFQVGDCVFDSPGHHGTPNQRLRAAVWGADLADSARPQGKILPSLTLAELFEAALPEFIAPDAP
jgi:hypothetical protein